VWPTVPGMFSSDLEGHAPSWPRSGTQARHAVTSIWLRPQVASSCFASEAQIS